jgi:hypothetical protein
MLVIIGCGKRKLRGTHPAADLYDSGYFRLKLEYARKIVDAEDSIIILSGKHGFLKLDDKIECYNQPISGPGAVTLETLQQQAQDMDVLGEETVVVLGGKQYVSRVKRLWPDCMTPLKGGIGDQQHWLKTQIDEQLN